MPTQRFDLELLQQLADTASDYPGITAEVFLMRGLRSPEYFETALSALDQVIPRSRRPTSNGLGHDGPDDDGNPALVGSALLGFFR